MSETWQLPGIQRTIGKQCPKCGCINVAINYNSVRDRIDRIDCYCRRCNYRWAEKPLDSKEQV